MKIKKRKLILELFLWLLAEVVLGYLELDNLADYGEYQNGKNLITILSHQ
jgi:hypothetical protein